MGLAITKGKDVSAALKERILIYGSAGIGKTRAALSLTPRFGRIAYYAADDGSEFLASLSAEKRERVLVVKPSGDSPEKNFMQFCMQDWTKIDPEIGTVVVDTFSTLAQEVLQWSANNNVVDREKHYIIGDLKNGGQAIPNRGDYQAIESMSRGFLKNIFAMQADKHIIFICHEEVKLLENVRAVGGPSHPGRSLVDFLPGQFATVIRLVREPVLVPGEYVPRDVVVAVTENDGKFVAKLRTGNEDEKNSNPLKRVTLNVNPVNLWEAYDNYLIKESK
jgi:hypothetical protein